MYWSTRGKWVITSAPISGPTSVLTALPTTLSASMSSPVSVSSSTAIRGFSIASCSISIFLRSPPEKPSLM